MSIERKQIGETEQYMGSKIVVRFMGPDVLCEVDGEEMPNFYTDAESARAAGRRYIDQVNKEKESLK